MDPNINPKITTFGLVLDPEMDPETLPKIGPKMHQMKRIPRYKIPGLGQLYTPGQAHFAKVIARLTVPNLHKYLNVSVVGHLVSPFRQAIMECVEYSIL